MLHIHHIAWWTRDGGRTEEANLTALCPFHHRLVHEGGWTITGTPTGRLSFTSPTGKVLTTGPPPLRDDELNGSSRRESTRSSLDHAHSKRSVRPAIPALDVRALAHGLRLMNVHGTDNVRDPQAGFIEARTR